MKEHQHTPGPWKWIANGPDDNNCYSLVDRGGHAVIEEYYDEVFPDDADTNLLRAAPDMLAALKEVAAATYPTRDGLVGGSVLRPRSSRLSRRLHDMVGAAIEKAEGGL